MTMTLMVSLLSLLVLAASGEALSLAVGVNVVVGSIYSLEIKFGAGNVTVPTPTQDMSFTGLQIASSTEQPLTSNVSAFSSFTLTLDSSQCPSSASAGTGIGGGVCLTTALVSAGLASMRSAAAGPIAALAAISCASGVQGSATCPSGELVVTYGSDLCFQGLTCGQGSCTITLTSASTCAPAALAVCPTGNCGCTWATPAGCVASSNDGSNCWCVCCCSHYGASCGSATAAPTTRAPTVPTIAAVPTTRAPTTPTTAPTTAAPTATPPPVAGSPTSGTWATGAATTFWDCNGGSCDAATLQPWNQALYLYAAEYRPLNPANYGGALYGEKMWLTAATSDPLSTLLGPDAPGCGTSTEGGCGKCLLIKVPSAVNSGWTAIVSKKNRCPPWSNGCATTDPPHLDVAVPGFDNLQYSTANICSASTTYIDQTGSSVCGTWYNSAASTDKSTCCNNMAATTPTQQALKASCQLFCSWGWTSGNPNFQYQIVTCPPAYQAIIKGAFGASGRTTVN